MSSSVGSPINSSQTPQLVYAPDDDTDDQDCPPAATTPSPYDAASQSALQYPSVSDSQAYADMQSQVVTGEVIQGVMSMLPFLLL
ncbi:hypothetical protein AWB78_08466 [Caballeronia calidae]|uniref:Uncharacterized protein n=1 Tax=Caballeronia calidae TaxID=1777139 RepID=A0A158EK59_9BURK|nr:hypothetical protein [Caballeronia calidae]SAL07194.1 hypothetical protein AWB78_08466 [Caballeronia calidae]